MEVFYLFPFPSFNMLDDCLRILIDADAYDSHFVSPFGGILFKHLLIMGHGLLARAAPSSPEVNQEDLTIFMLDGLFFLFVDINDFLNLFEFLADC
jgi:hypothetical protein